MALILYKICMC